MQFGRGIQPFPTSRIQPPTLCTASPFPSWGGLQWCSASMVHRDQPTRDLPPSNNNETRSNPPAWTIRSTDNRDSPSASHTPFSNYNSSSAFLHSHSRQQRREDGTPATSAAHACSEANTLNSDVMKNQVTPSEDHVDMTGDDGIVQTRLQSLPTSLRAKWRDMCRDEAVKSGTVTGESSDASTREA